jgi:hypothetical protein
MHSMNCRQCPALPELEGEGMQEVGEADPAMPEEAAERQDVEHILHAVSQAPQVAVEASSWRTWGQSPRP